MLNEDVRAARLEAGLTISDVAKRANVHRKLVYQLENGENVTLETIRKIVAVIPNLKQTTIGGLKVTVANADLDAAQEAARDLLDAAKRLMSALGAASVTEAVRRPVGEETPASTERGRRRKP